MTTFAVIPVKRLDEAKSRLSPALTENERRHFCLKMLEDVLGALNSTAGVYRTVVVSLDQNVLQLAESRGASSIKETRLGLNSAVQEGVNWCIQREASSTLILPSDIPLVTPRDLRDLLSLREKAAMVISSSRDGGGTNALLLTPPNVISTYYGIGSFQRHIEEATKLRLKFLVSGSPRIALDIDTMKDLVTLASLNKAESHANRFLKKIEMPKRLKRGVEEL